MLDYNATIEDLLVETAALKDVVYRLSCVIAAHARLVGDDSSLRAALDYRPTDPSQVGENIVPLHPAKSPEIKAAINARVDEMLSQIADFTVNSSHGRS
jgi:DNA-binding transcriptional regulator YdaS (Cro superfamily)